MIRFSALGVQFVIPVIALCMPVLARLLGLRAMIAPTAFALTLHELAHLICARMLRAQIAEIRLMPFGGSIRLENPYLLRPVQIMLIAAAGPAGNLVGTICAAAAAHFHLLSPRIAAQFIQASTILMLFNLFPALPLDGGRIAHAALQSRFGRRRALKICLGVSAGTSIALTAAFGAGLIRTGSANITLILSALLLFTAGRDEYTALNLAEAMRFVRKDEKSPRPARIYQLDEDMPARDALRLVHPKEDAWFVLLRRGRPYAAIDADGLMLKIQNGTAVQSPLRDFPAMRLILPV